MALPLTTPGLPGTGGHIGPAPEDFRVTEVPSYPASGSGEHCFVLLRKTGITSYEAVGRLARALSVRPGDVGIAGLKDRWAVTEQWVSVPGVRPEQVSTLTLPELEILEAARHPHKLRTGHLRGNRFSIRLVDLEGPDAAARAEAVLAVLAEQGCRHYFGPQRFGRDGGNADAARAMLRGERGPRDRRKRRLLLSALQAELFNGYLAARCGVASLERPLRGEIVQRTDSGGIFVAEDLDEVAGRMACGEVVPTGPLYGPKMRRPDPASPARELEDRVLADASLELAAFGAWKRLAPGGRRPLLVRPSETWVRAEGPALELGFFLSSGAYATVVLGEVTKTPWGDLRPGSRRPARSDGSP